MITERRFEAITLQNTLFKVHQLVEIVKTNFQKVLNPSPFHFVDESMTVLEADAVRRNMSLLNQQRYGPEMTLHAITRASLKYTGVKRKMRKETPKMVSSLG